MKLSRLLNIWGVWMLFTINVIVWPRVTLELNWFIVSLLLVNWQIIVFMIVVIPELGSYTVNVHSTVWIVDMFNSL